MSSVGTRHINGIKCTVPTELNRFSSLFISGLKSAATISAIPTGFSVGVNS